MQPMHEDSFELLKKQLKEVQDNQQKYKESGKDRTIEDIVRETRPAENRCHTYLFPFVRYAYGEDVSIAFTHIQPTEAWISNEKGFTSKDKPLLHLLVPNHIINYLPNNKNSTPDLVCAFTVLKNAQHFHSFKCGTDNEGNGYVILVFKLDDIESVSFFLESKYSKMYKDWLPANKRLFVRRMHGVGMESYVWSVCTRSPVRVAFCARLFDVAPEQIGECDSKMSGITYEKELWINSVYNNDSLY